MKNRILSKKTRVAIYCRVSSDEAGQSLAEQVNICKDHARIAAKSRNVEIEFTHVLVEEAGTSGKDANRPKYQFLLRLIRGRLIDWTVAKEISRFSRNIGDFHSFVEECRSRDVSVFIPGLDVDLKSPAGEIVPNMLAVFAQYERKIIAQRTSSSIRSLTKTKAKIHGQPVILGFKRSDSDRGVWIPLEDKISDVVTIFKTFVKYTSYKTTVEYLKKIGIKNQTGSDFDHSSLKRILTNRKYIGKLKVPGEELEVDLPFGAVVPIDLFEKTQVVIQALESALKSKNRNSKRVYLLTGLLFTIKGNSFKGVSAHGRSKKVFCYYRSKEEDLTFSCEEIESAVLRSVDSICEKEGMAEYKSELESSQSDKKKLLKRGISQISKEIDHLISFKSKSLDTILSQGDASSVLIKEVEQRIIEINGQIEEKSKKRDSLSLELEGIMELDAGLQSFERLVKASERPAKDYSDREAVRGWLRSLFQKVVVDIKSKKIHILWNDEITGGKTLLPFKIDIPVGSRKTAILSALDVNINKIQESKLYELAVKDKKTSSQIAKDLGVSRSTVSKYLKQFSIPTLSVGTNKKRVRGLKYGTKVLKSGKRIHVSDEQKIAFAIKTWREQGKSFREIADILNVQRTPTKTGEGKWHGKTIHQIINANFTS
jgi:DNA invertase Pin-like site-specific DNA recombinase